MSETKSTTIVSIDECRSGKGSIPDSAHVVWLHDDFLALTELERIVGRKIETPTRLFHRVVAECGEDWLALWDRARELNSPRVFWSAQIGSRSVTADPLAKNLAYLEVAKRVRADRSGAVVFIVDSPALGEALAIEFASDHAGWTTRRRARAAVLAIKSLARACVFLATSWKIWLQTRSELPRFAKPRGRAVLLRTWVTAGSLSSSGHRTIFKDRNFGELSTYFVEHGIEPVIMPMFFNLQESEADTLRKLAKTGIHFVAPENVLSLFPSFKTFVFGLRSVFLRFRDLTISGVDVSAMFREAHLARACSPDYLRLGLSGEVLRTLARRDWQFERILYPFENNASEKQFLLSCRKAFPGVETVGFQHSVWYREQLSMSLTTKDKETMPLPDTILTKGRIYLDVLGKLGYPRVQLGANLRFPEIGAIQFRRGRATEPTLAVVLNYSLRHSGEMLKGLFEAWPSVVEKFPRAVIRIKTHPLLDESEIRRWVESSGTDAGFATMDVRTHVADAHAVLMVGGSVSSLETLISGVPLVRWSQAGDFDLDCIWDDHPFREFVCTPEELSNRLVSIFEAGSALDEVLHVISSRTREIYFEPMTRESLRAFLPRGEDR